MAVLEVIKMGHPTLREKAEEVKIEEIKDGSIEKLVKDMFDTMQAENGIGIAAPQVNVKKQVCIVGLPSPTEEDPEGFEAVVVINPKLTVLDEELLGNWEGCLSVPQLRGYVERPKAVRVEYTNLEGEPEIIEAEGFPAVVFQHELDHLEGKLYVDHIKDITKFSYLDEFEKFHGEND